MFASLTLANPTYEKYFIISMEVQPMFFFLVIRSKSINPEYYCEYFLIMP